MCVEGVSPHQSFGLLTLNALLCVAPECASGWWIAGGGECMGGGGCWVLRAGCCLLDVGCGMLGSRCGSPGIKKTWCSCSCVLRAQILGNLHAYSLVRNLWFTRSLKTRTTKKNK